MTLETRVKLGRDQLVVLARRKSSVQIAVRSYPNLMLESSVKYVKIGFTQSARKLLMMCTGF